MGRVGKKIRMKSFRRTFQMELIKKKMVSEMSRSYPKLNSLKVKNFRCIGNESVTIDLDDIVVLVGGNNAGKSTILRAYELAVSSEKMTLDDFYNKEIDAKNLPEVEIHTLVNSETAPKIDLSLSYCIMKTTFR